MQLWASTESIMQMICCCGNTLNNKNWLRIAVEWGWGGIWRALWPCCSWCGYSLITVQWAFWGTQLHWDLLLQYRTSPVRQRMCVPLLEFTDHASASFYAWGLSSKKSSVVSGLRGQMGSNPYVENAFSNLPHQNLFAAMSSLKLSSVAVLQVSVSPERGCKWGSTLTSSQTSVRRSAIRSFT